MKDYLLLFRGGDMSNLSEEEKQKHLLSWGNWMRGLSDKGQFLGGEPLGKEARVIKGNKKIVTDGPYAESKEMIGGYLIIKAGDINEATEISKGCPIFETNGITEVREIHHMEF